MRHCASAGVQSFAAVKKGRGLQPIVSAVRRIALPIVLLCLATGLALGGGPAVRSADAAPPTTYRDEVLADNPVSYWRFNEASGTAFVDDKGANNGTLIGPVSFGQPGAIVSDPTNKSASFNGTSAALSVPSSSSLNASSAVSVEVWIKRQNGGVFQAVVGKALNGQSKLENYSIWLNASNQVRAYFGNGTTYATTYSSVALTPTGTRSSRRTTTRRPRSTSTACCVAQRPRPWAFI